MSRRAANVGCASAIVELAPKAMLIALLLLCLHPTLSLGRQAAGSEATRSLVALLASMDSYNGQRIRTFGFFQLGDERSAVFLSEADAKNGIYANGVWLDLEGAAVAVETIKSLNGKYILVEGTFDANQRGHMDLYSGGIRSVTRIASWGSKAEAEPTNSLMPQP